MNNYALDTKRLTLIDSHFGTEIFLLESTYRKYIVKMLPIEYNADFETEGQVTVYLQYSGLNVSRLLKTHEGMYHVKTDSMHFALMECAERETLPLNSAPDWFMDIPNIFRSSATK